MSGHWEEYCIQHLNSRAAAFLKVFFGNTQRRVLLIAGIGFDPRTLQITKLLAPILEDRIQGVFLREHRSDPNPKLTNLADTHGVTMHRIILNSKVITIPIFHDQDQAVTGGVRLVENISKIDLSDVTDVVLDLSALSTGISFTIVRLLLELCKLPAKVTNLHALLSFHTGIDEKIHRDDDDRISVPHGYRAMQALEEDRNIPQLWIPILSARKQEAMKRIATSFDDSVDICPVLPFPARDPLQADRLAETFRVQFEDAWQVDSRDIIYAAEDDPLDLFRTILQLHQRRRRAFEHLGGSQIVLTPGGGKVLSLGGMMAAIHLDLPVLYVEDRNYSIKEEGPLPRSHADDSQLLHLWLHGEAYPTSGGDDGK